MSFRITCLLSAALCAMLCVALLLSPSLIYFFFSMEGSLGADIISRRAAMLFAGLSVILWHLQSLPEGEARQGLSKGVAVAMGGLAVVGLVEYARGAVGPGIFLAIVTELCFFWLFVRHAKQRI